MFRFLFPSRRRGTPAARRRPTARLTVESLDGRLVPSAVSPAPVRQPWLAQVAEVAPVPVGEHALPMRMQGEGTAVVTNELDNGDLVVHFTASGTATHLGRWTVETTVTFTPVRDENGQPTDLYKGTGLLTYHAANGDTLSRECKATFDKSTGQFHAECTWVGGTGRFEGAGGHVVCTAQITDPGTGALTCTCTGWISY